MYPKVKMMKKRDDGFLEVKIKKQSDFDDYLFHKLYEDENCMICIRDHQDPCRFYYDTNGFIPLSLYLKHHLFKEYELLNFMIFLMEHLLSVNASKPVYLNTQYIFLSNHDQQLKFLVIPVKLDGWMFQQSLMKQFIKQILKFVKTKCDYHTVGVLLQEVKEDDFSFPIMLQTLHELKECQIKKIPWWKRHKQSKRTYFDVDGIYEDYGIQDAIRLPVQEESIEEIAVQTPRISIKEATSNVDGYFEEATVVLFHPQQNPYLVHKQMNTTYELLPQEMSIGRSPDNDIVMNHPGISNYHAKIDVCNKELIDMRSRNGTYVNKQLIAHHQLKDGDEIRIADDVFIYHDCDAYET